MANKRSELNERFVNPDLTKERKGASFVADEMTYAFDGNRRRTLRRRDIENIVFSDSVMQQFPIEDSIYYTYQEKYNAAVARGVRLYELGKERGWSPEDNNFALGAISGGVSFGLHWGMFIPTISSLGTPEQKEKWLPPSESLQIIGCYCQSELGHGSNLRELETVARYDPASEEFILNTPKYSSIKWWPGGMGKTGTHAVLFAQLEVGSQRHGFHAFIVPIRSRVDHQPLPGVSVGCIGPRMAMNVLDNGYLALKNVRIPRENLLMKNATVTRDGRYVSSASKQANYAALVYGRVGVVSFTLQSYKMSVITAVRYSAVRRQSSVKIGQPECQVLDYQTQQYKVFPALCVAYAMFFVSRKLKQKYTDVVNGNKADKHIFQELHIIISGAKALNSDLAVKYATVCVRACGGHGYLLASGQPQALSENIAHSMVEGENTVMYLQVSRYLLKMMNQLQFGKEIRQMSTYYLNKYNKPYTCPLVTEDDCWKPEAFVLIYEKRSSSLLSRVVQSIENDVGFGLSMEEAVHKNQQALVQCAKAHCYVQEVKDYVESVRELSVGRNLKIVLSNLCLLFSVNHLLEQHGDFLESEAVSATQIAWLRRTEIALMKKIRPEAVVLVDAFDVHDKTLSSAIGNFDGLVYENLYKSAMKDPMNQTQVHPSYQQYLKKYLSAKL